MLTDMHCLSHNRANTFAGNTEGLSKVSMDYNLHGISKLNNRNNNATVHNAKGDYELLN